MPTLSDFRAEMNGSKYFSKIDLKQAYHQLELKEESRYITTFSTHEGLFRYKRLHELRNEQCARTFSEHFATKS